MADRWDPTVWTTSWLFWPVRHAARRFEAHAGWPALAEYDGVVAPFAPMRFVAAPPRRRRRGRGAPSLELQYDARIHQRGEVPCRRASWHDFFNALVWTAFPRAKAALHARQYRTVAARGRDERGFPAARTREQDALALLDEGGALVLCADAAADSLCAELGATGAGASALPQLVAAGQATVAVFGHALYEHMARGDATARAAAFVVAAATVPREPARRLRLLDAALAAAIDDPASFREPEARSSFVLAQVATLPTPP